MQNPWMITLVGLATVFLALACLIGMVSLFRLIFSKRPQKNRPFPAPLPEVSGPSNRNAKAPEAAPQEPAGPGGELIAVIAAAIAASEGRPASSFRIASIAPSAEAGGFNTPVWGRIERLTRAN